MTVQETHEKWTQLTRKVAEDFGTEKPDVKALLFLIGVQELGQGPRRFSKREKEELMHIANCRLFSELGYYELEGVDRQGWPIWKNVKKIPNYTVFEQELLIKQLIIHYFDEQGLL